MTWRRGAGMALLLIASLLWLPGLYFCLRWAALPLLPPREALESAAPAIALYCLGWGAVLLLRAVRLWVLLKAVHPLSLTTTLRISFVFFGALVTMPFRSAEVVRPALLLRAGVPPLGAVSVSAVERLLDGAVVSLLLLAALTFGGTSFDGTLGALPITRAQLAVGARGVALMFSLLLLAAVLAALRPRWVEQGVASTVGRVSAGAAIRVSAALAGLASAATFVSDARLRLRVAALTVACWLCSAAALWLLIVGAGISCGPLAPVIAIGVLSLGVTTPSGPGMFGTFQLALYAGLAIALPPSTPPTLVAVVVFGAYLAQVQLTAVAGFAALLLEALAQPAAGVTPSVAESRSGRVGAISPEPSD